MFPKGKVLILDLYNGILGRAWYVLSYLTMVCGSLYYATWTQRHPFATVHLYCQMTFKHEMNRVHLTGDFISFFFLLLL